MCDPITIAGAALMAGSVAANSAAASQVANARAAALAAQNQEQSALNAQTKTVNDKADANYNNFGNQQQQQAQNLAALYTAAKANPPNAAYAVPKSSSNIVNSEDQKQTGIADAFAQKTGDALANMRSFGQALGQDSIATARNAGQLTQLNNFKQGDAAVLPYQLDAANQAGNGMKLFGDILGGVGQLGTAYGLRTNPSTASALSLFNPAKTIATTGATGSPQVLGGFTGTPTTTTPTLGSLY